VIAAADSPDSQIERQRVVLVVEDDVLERGPLAEYLRDAGFRVIEAANAREAVEVLSAEDGVDIVFSDIRMPGSMDGIGLAGWISENRSELPVLLTSGDHGLRLHGGFARERYIAKPYIYREVELRLRRLLGDDRA
jgi:DNA-binding NtrC family response regulator